MVKERSRYPLVSVILPTLNCVAIIGQCVESISRQTYPNIEIVAVDAKSVDGTAEILGKYGKVFPFQLEPYMAWGTPYQQNFGAIQAKGEYLYFVDSDMVLPPEAIEKYVRQMEDEKADSLIVPEISYGEGFWAKCKILERSAYLLGDLTIEAPRFHRKRVWDKLGGLDPRMGGQYDWDIHARLLDKGYKVVRSSIAIYHDEGRLRLSKLARKKYVYGRTAWIYLSKYKGRRDVVTSQFNLVRPVYFRNWKALVADPIHALGFVAMKSLEGAAFFVGLCSTKMPKWQG